MGGFAFVKDGEAFGVPVICSSAAVTAPPGPSAGVLTLCSLPRVLPGVVGWHGGGDGMGVDVPAGPGVPRPRDVIRQRRAFRDGGEHSGGLVASAGRSVGGVFPGHGAGGR